MKKYLGMSLVMVGMVFFLSGCSTPSQETESQALSQLVAKDTTTVPTRPAEVNGIIASIDGSKLIIKNEVGKKVLSEEEQAAVKAERQKMTQEERQALRAEELASTATEDMEVTIPVGTPLYKGTGTGDGTTVPAEFSEMQKGLYISVWKQGDGVEAAKLKGV